MGVGVLKVGGVGGGFTSTFGVFMTVVGVLGLVVVPPALTLRLVAVLTAVFDTFDPPP